MGWPQFVNVHTIADVLYRRKAATSLQPSMELLYSHWLYAGFYIASLHTKMQVWLRLQSVAKDGIVQPTNGSLYRSIDYIQLPIDLLCTTPSTYALVLFNVHSRILNSDSTKTHLCVDTMNRSVTQT